MAYQTRGRNPLFDSDTQAVLEKRGKELVGIALIAVGVALTAMLATYAPGDPSWLAATSEPVQNALGRLGASIASPMMIIAGIGSWGVPVAFLMWGGRFVFHAGADRAVSRAIFVPIGVALLSVYLSTHAPGPGWGQSFGLGGLFGDTLLGTLLGLAGVQAAFGLKLIAFVMMLATLVVGGFVLGFTTGEVKGILNWMLRGTVMCYATIVAVLGLGGRGVSAGMKGSARMAAGRIETARARRAERAELRRAEDEETLLEPADAGRTRPVLRAVRGAQDSWESDDRWDDDDLIADDPEIEAPNAGLLSRLGGALRRRGLEGDAELYEEESEGDSDGDDRVRAKISNAIRQRARSRPVQPGPSRAEPQLKSRHPRGPQPIILPKTPPAAAAEAGFDAQDHSPDGYDDDRYQPVEDDRDYDTMADYEAEDHASAGMEAPVRPNAPQVAPAIKREAPKVREQQVQEKPLVRSAKAADASPRSVDPTDTGYENPPLDLLADPKSVERHVLSDEALEENARTLETVLEDYGVKGEIVSVRPGPVVTMYELEPAPGLKASRVIGLADDIARSMSALSARVSTVPGRSVIGIELPNENREMCVLREILAARDFTDGTARLPLALGKDIGGDPVVANLAKMPHLLIAGTTGSGKSVAINTMILSLLYKLTPEECRMIMIDPKMLELSVYDGIPHLLSPVVTDPKKAVVALKWVVGEMEDRYRKMSKMGVRNIDGYNGRVRDALSKGELFERTVQTGFDEDTGEPIFETEESQPEILPFIVVVVDEMADLMMVAGKEIEACIQRLAQMARASGIHLIMATQRPSVDVITGTIKANFPTRISFQVTSKIDSRTILGEQGAEQLLGMGDMLYMAGGSRITRVHGPFCSDEEVEEIVNYLKSFGPPDYKSGVVEGPNEEKSSDIDAVLGLGAGGNSDGEDALYDQAVQIVARDRKCSTSYIQRKLGIGYNKAARLVEQMEDQGVVSSANHVGKREVLVPEIQ